MKADASAALDDGPGHADVHIGRDGWLFLTGGRNRVLAQYESPGFPRMGLWHWRRVLEHRVLRCARLGIRYVHAIAPEKVAVYDHELDGLALDAGRAPALRLSHWLRLSRARGTLVDLTGPLRSGARQVPLYRRTDSHWTFEGCLVAYAAICRHFGVEPRSDIAARRIGSSATFAGDLGTKFDPPITETAETCLFESAARRVHANAMLLAFEAEGRGYDAHIGAHAVFRNEAAPDPRRLVVFGDSYAHHTAHPHTGTLTPMLADTFREVHFLWSTSIDWTYLARVRPDFVLSEIAERFMVDLPQRGFTIERLAQLAIERKLAGPH